MMGKQTEIRVWSKLDSTLVPPGRKNPFPAEIEQYSVHLETANTDSLRRPIKKNFFMITRKHQAKIPQPASGSTFVKRAIYGPRLLICKTSCRGCAILLLISS